MQADIHPREDERLAALRRYDIVDTPSEADFDDVVDVTARLCEAPICTITLIDADRQWFKAEIGFGFRESPRALSACAHTILLDGPLEVPDTRQDARFSDNPAVMADPGIRFYAGLSLRTPDGLPLGTLCVMDTKPRHLTDLQRDALRVLAAQVMKQLDLRRALRDLAALRQEADHRIKNSLQSVSALIRLEARAATQPETRAALDVTQARVETFATLHDLLGQTTDDGGVALDAYLGRVCDLLRGTLPPGIVLTARLDPAMAPPDRAAAIAMILNEWCMNAVKHAFPNGNPGTITVRGQRDRDRYTLACIDDGSGGPDHAPPSVGIGTTVIRAATAQLGAASRRLDLPAGTGWEIEVPLAQS